MRIALIKWLFCLGTLLFLFPLHSSAKITVNVATTIAKNGGNTQSITNNNEYIKQKPHETKDVGVPALLFIILALIIGAATRRFAKKSPFPFTVLLLIIGLLMGLINRMEYLSTVNFSLFHLDFSSIGNAIDFAANINPHLLLFIFLPILIFEASFAMDLHTFKKTARNSILLAVPGILIALGATAAFAMLLKYTSLGLDNWNWQLALMFGAVISATDPVAVVALLKDLGASKRLGTLIEGESLLNDGTAIVFFMVFFMAITAAGNENYPVLEFFKVAFGGMLIGLVLGYVVIYWLKTIINDSLVENSLVIASAYLTYFIAEYIFHVSGVIGLVALGLVIGGVGRSSISPKVETFMHEFWNLAGFISNCLIFLIVGIVVAERSVFTLNDFILLILFYIGIHLARALVILILYPFMKRTSYGLPKKEAIVIWFGGLRGAIALALALIVAGVDNQYISQEIKDQFLFFTAGIVTLTLLINATTIQYIVKGLGLTEISSAKAGMLTNARKYLYQTSTNQLAVLKEDRYIKLSDWDLVEKYLPKEKGAENVKKVERKKALAEMRKRFLEAEKSSYWYQFRDGLLGPSAVRLLSDNISHLLDRGGELPLSNRKDLEEKWELPQFFHRLIKFPFFGKMTKDWYLDRMMLSFDCSMSFVIAQEAGLKLMESIRQNEKGDMKVLDVIEEELNANRIEGNTFLRNLRINYPEEYQSVSTTQAVRSLLNYESKTIVSLAKKGRIDAEEAQRMMESIDSRTRKLQKHPPKMGGEILES